MSSNNTTDTTNTINEDINKTIKDNETINDDDIIDVSSEDEDMISMTELVINMMNRVNTTEPSTPSPTINPEEVD